jgi:uncharacterized membrane protein
MVALLVGIVLLLFAVYAVLPVSWSLQWGPYVVEFLKGGAPILALIVGIVALFIGIADIKDRIEAKKRKKRTQRKNNP